MGGWAGALQHLAAGGMNLDVLDVDDYRYVEAAFVSAYRDLREVVIGQIDALVAGPNDGIGAQWTIASRRLADVLGDTILDASIGVGITHGFAVSDPALAKAVKQHAEALEAFGPKLQESMANWVVKQKAAGMSKAEIAAALRSAASPLSDEKAMNFARNEAVAASNAGVYAGWEQSGIPAKAWVTSRDERVRPAHVAMEGQVVAMDEMFSVDGFPARYPGDPMLPIGLRINCFPSDQVVTASGVELAFSRPYAGDVVELLTAGGHKLTVTPNHPVMTTDGPIPAGKVVRGAHVLVNRSVVPDRLRAQPDVDDDPASIKQIIVAAERLGLGERGAIVSMDFHGDGLAGEVNVVAIDPELWDRAQADAQKPALEFALAPAGVSQCPLASGRLAPQLDRSNRTSPSSDVGVTSESATLIDVEPAHAHRLLFAAVAHGHPLSTQPAHNGWPTDVELASQDLWSLAGQVAADEVVGVRRYEWSGHVHTLQTRSSFFEADGIIVGNCRCTVQASTNGKLMKGMASTKPELVGFARQLGIRTTGMKKADVQQALLAYSCKKGRPKALLAGGSPSADAACPLCIEELSRNQLLVHARILGLPGRHLMNRDQLSTLVAMELAKRNDDVALQARAYAPKKAFAAARKLADLKTRSVPMPSDEAILGGLKAAAEAQLLGKRAGGEKRSGAEVRRSRDAKLWEQFGGHQRGYVPCVYCASKLHYLDAKRHPEDNPLRFEKFQRDKIIDSKSGGTYLVENILPACSGCNNARKNTSHGFKLPAWGDPQAHAKKRAEALLGPGAWDNPAKYAEQLGVASLQASSQPGVALSAWQSALNRTRQPVSTASASVPADSSSSSTTMASRPTSSPTTPLLKGSSRWPTSRRSATGDTASAASPSTPTASSAWSQAELKPRPRRWTRS